VLCFIPSFLTRAKSMDREDLAELPFILELAEESTIETAGDITAVVVAGSMEIAKDVIDSKSV
jgi:hypothetical protein